MKYAIGKFCRSIFLYLPYLHVHVGHHLVCHTVDLQVAVKTNLTTLGGQLIADEIKTPDQYEEIRNPH